MSSEQKSPLYTYPMRGLGVIAIFLALGPLVQTIANAYLVHTWTGGSNLLVEIFDVLTKEAGPHIRANYSYYMPSVFMSGVWCSLAPSRGEGLALSTAVIRTIIVNFLIETFYIFLAPAYKDYIYSLGVGQQLFLGIIQWLFVGWICWILATGFRLDKPVAK